MYYKSIFPDPPEVAESNIHDLIFNRPDQREWPDYTLFINAATGQRCSFKQFIERVRDGATALGTDVAQGGLGLRPENGELVGILSDSCPDYIALMHSLLVITVPFALFSSYSTPHELKHANSLTRVTRIFVSPSLLPLALTTGLPADRIYLLEGEDASYDHFVSLARKSGIPRLPVRQAKKDTLAYLVFSSGTSGPPKGMHLFSLQKYVHVTVMISHGNITHAILGMMVCGLEIVKILEPPAWNTPDGIPVYFNVLPVYHTFALFLTAFFNFYPEISHYEDRPRSITCPPASSPSRFKTTDMSSVQSINSGAAYLPPQLADEFCARFPNMDSITEGAFSIPYCMRIIMALPFTFTGYGLSEFTAGVSMRPIPGMLNGRAKNKPGSVGILLPGIEARIVRPDESLACPNEAGELLVRGGATALGYKENDKATRETFVDGWVRTGDHIRIDADGVLFFEDRTKASLHRLHVIHWYCTEPPQDTLKISGMQVSPVEIENTLLSQPDKLIIDVCVAGVSGGRTSDERIPRAWIVLSPAGVALGEKEPLQGLMHGCRSG
ncbi:hypothetical protein BDR07DRAFT_1484318 [Suillus spraguei]|nr:hypothetical protein BDR07DRAFT_1484318 [Suillus spraguei]